MSALLEPPAASITTAIKEAANALHGRSDSPRLDAEILLARVLDLPRSALIVRGDETLSPERRASFAALIERRVAGEPVAYLTGSREFWSMTLCVSPAVLVPRPETELLVELALSFLPPGGPFPGETPSGEPLRVLDLGTGSGAIALALGLERPDARITGVDISSAALAVAIQNAERLEQSGVRWRIGSWFEAVPGEHFDLILANPPYIAAGDPALTDLASEPMLALSPGPTGLEAITEIALRAADHLRPHGRLLLEHGASQAEAVSGLLVQHGWADIRTHADYAGRPRVTAARVGSP
jgi:release factor glutamine methyltransferase